MEFRTELNIPKSEIQIDHFNKIMTIGSCFAENISEYLKFYRFNILENPFGVLYNPLSILNSIKLIFEGKIFQEPDLIYDQSEYHSFYHHSNFSHHESNECLSRINEGLENTRAFLEECDFLIITYGTAYVYKHKSTGLIVSNCHKIPANEFERYRLSISEAKNSMQSTIDLLTKLNRELKITFTVSPVRHLKDGAAENQLSKSILLLAVNELVNENSNCIYFPSYELMMDDLRDYRFYESDLTHPNKIATDYIWGKFSQCCLSNECLILIKEIEQISQARMHRPRNILSPVHQNFINRQLVTIKKLETKYPYLNLREDYEYFLRQKKD